MKIPSDLHGVELANKLRVLGYDTTRQTGSHRRLMRLMSMCEQCDIAMPELLRQLGL